MLAKFTVAALVGVASARMVFRETAEDFESDIGNFENDFNADVFGKENDLDDEFGGNFEAGDNLTMDFEAGDNNDGGDFKSQFAGRFKGGRTQRSMSRFTGPSRPAGPSRPSMSARRGAPTMKNKARTGPMFGPRGTYVPEVRDEGKETWHSNEQEYSNNTIRYYSDCTKHTFAVCELKQSGEATLSGKIRLQQKPYDAVAALFNLDNGTADETYKIMVNYLGVLGDDCSKAGSEFRPLGEYSKSGRPNPHQDPTYGRFPDVKADADGKVTAEQMSDVFYNLAGKESILGRAISIFAESDLSRPQACCVIGLDETPAHLEVKGPPMPEPEKKEEEPKEEEPKKEEPKAEAPKDESPQSMAPMVSVPDIPMHSPEAYRPGAYSPGSYRPSTPRPAPGKPGTPAWMQRTPDYSAHQGGYTGYKNTNVAGVKKVYVNNPHEPYVRQRNYLDQASGKHQAYRGASEEGGRQSAERYKGYGGSSSNGGYGGKTYGNGQFSGNVSGQHKGAYAGFTKGHTQGYNAKQGPFHRSYGKGYGKSYGSQYAQPMRGPSQGSYRGGPRSIGIDFNSIRGRSSNGGLSGGRYY